MKEQEILDTFKTLACSQGFYGRMYHALIEARDSDNEEDNDNYYDFMADLEAQAFSSPVDLVMYLEC